MTKKLLTLMLVLCLLVTSVMIPSHANDSEATDNPEYDKITGLSLKGEEEQKEEETGENEFTFSDAIALGTHVFDYVDRKQFEESGHVARPEPLEESLCQWKRKKVRRNFQIRKIYFDSRLSPIWR